MFKYVVSAVLCFGTGVSCISQEVPREVKLPFGLTVSPALVYAASGNMHLMLRDFEMALEDFRRASFYAEQGGQESEDEADFITLFGQVVAYDNLNMRDKCDQALSALILSINEDDDEEEEEDDDDFNFSLKESDKMVQELATLAIQVYFYGEFYKMMRELALLAPSDNVREALISILDEDVDE
jgi:hypothetical protein